MTSGRIPAGLRRRIRREAGDRCGYCLSAQRYVFAPLEIEHIIPQAAGGSDEEGNLWLACPMCNSYKGAQTEALDPETGERVRLFDPRSQKWLEHFSWRTDGTAIIGRTACGRATVLALQLNNTLAVMIRREWVSAGWHPPVET
jgi:hypothetical protein